MSHSRRQRLRHNCRRKVAFDTWDAAEAEGIRVWRMRGTRANPATPYPCAVCGRYHLANRVRPLPRPTGRRDRILASVPLNVA